MARWEIILVILWALSRHPPEKKERGVANTEGRVVGPQRQLLELGAGSWGYQQPLDAQEISSADSEFGTIKLILYFWLPELWDYTTELMVNLLTNNNKMIKCSIYFLEQQWQSTPNNRNLITCSSGSCNWKIRHWQGWTLLSSGEDSLLIPRSSSSCWLFVAIFGTTIFSHLTQLSPHLPTCTWLQVLPYINLWLHYNLITCKDSLSIDIWGDSSVNKALPV